MINTFVNERAGKLPGMKPRSQGDSTYGYKIRAAMLTSIACQEGCYVC